MSITVSGVTYSLEHLETYTYNDIPMEDWRGSVFKRPVKVAYSCHCYSTEVKPGTLIAADALILDGSKKREFDPTRHDHSHGLPKIVYSMLTSGSAVVWSTAHHNRHYSQLIGSPNPNAAVPYYLFMRIQKEQTDRGPKMMKLVVESAYGITNGIYPRSRAMLTMGQWLGEVWTQK